MPQVSPGANPLLSSASQAGLPNNLHNGLAWEPFPLLFASGGLSLTQIGVFCVLYPAVCGLGQITTGPLADWYGRKPFNVDSMLLQATALGAVAIGQVFPV